MSVPISILIPIKNEAGNLPRCLQSVRWADEIIVVDSQSSDGSIQIAEQHGARVVQFHFNGVWPKKKNWALENVPFKHEWVFILDADETLPPEAEAEFLSIVSDTKADVVGYWINRRFRFMGRWLKHAYYPNWNLRLFKHRLGRYEQATAQNTQSGDNEVHEHVIVQGRTGRLKAEMDHFAFPSVDVFMEKHNRYSNWEARVALDGRLSSAEHVQDPQVARRRALKRISHELPFRPLLRFAYIYFWQRGFLDGLEGYYFARLHATYEFLSVAKTYELAADRAEQTAPATPLNFTLARVLVGAYTALILWFTLTPTPGGGRAKELGSRLAAIVNASDFLSNLLAFALLAGGAFVLGSASFGKASARSFFRRRPAVLATLLLLVMLLEAAQFFIPGRVPDLLDLAAGWGGVALVWVGALYLRAQRRRSANE
ncbi:MAG TPA: glycosyltransferase family 2 protein [Methylomirabilota bacterium]|nr:glycosyltransferase family 2 protein [Methylomirabilota bacterium]